MRRSDVATASSASTDNNLRIQTGRDPLGAIAELLAPAQRRPLGPNLQTFISSGRNCDFSIGRRHWTSQNRGPVADQKAIDSRRLTLAPSSDAEHRARTDGWQRGIRRIG